MISPALNDEEALKTVNKNQVIPQTSPHLNENFPTNFNIETKQRRLYEIWPGNNKFYCGGRLIHGSNLTGILTVIALKVVICGIFFGLATPYLWKFGSLY